MKDKLLIEYLYLDLFSCERCVSNDKQLESVITALKPALELAGYDLEYKKIEMTTEEIAKEYHFVSSPTIRINGRDICKSVQENNCSCCGEISDEQVDCRVFEYKGSIYEIAPEELLARAILNEIHLENPKEKQTKYALPKNLKVFYDGKKRKQKCNCTTKCCK